MTYPRSEERVFRKAYAERYDLFYAEKDYEAECDMLENAFHQYGKGKIRTVLDLGCGTGNHAFPLAKRGYKVTGVDRSPNMLAEALSKVARFKSQTQLSPEFLQGELRSLNLGRRFDAVLMMFAVLGYQVSNEDVLAALTTVRRHLKPHGLFVCDVWYGPAVLAIRPSDKIKIIPVDNGKVIRLASGDLDIHHHLATVEYHILHLQDKAVLNESTETHHMRYFFPQELAFFMKQANLNMLHLCTFSDLALEAGEHSWNVLVVAR
jgi:SAM-dependent methyltransferase